MLLGQDPLPAGLVRRNNSWMLDKKIGGRRIRLSLGRCHTRTAIVRFHRKLQELTAKYAPILARENDFSTLWSIEIESQDWPTKLYRTAQTKARSRGLSFDMSLKGFKDLLHASGGYCQLTGVPFSFEKEPHARVAPYRPSLDRISCRNGYHPDNCRFVCLAVNIALNDFGDRAFHRISTAYVLRALQKIDVTSGHRQTTIDDPSS